MGFCSGCGSEVNENSSFCSKCGTKVVNQSKQGGIESPNCTYENNSTSKSSGNKYIGMAAVGVVCLLVLFLLVKFIGLFTTPGYEKPVKYLFNGIKKESFNTMMKAFPDFMIDEIEDEIDEDEKDEYMEDLTDALQLLYGKNVKISYKVTDKEKLDKDDLSELEDTFKRRYDKKVKVKAGYNLDIEIKIKGKKNSDTHDTEMTVYKVGSRWYITEDAFNFF